MNTKFNDLFKSFDNCVKVRSLNNGNSVISGFGSGLRLSGVFNESMISVNLSNKGEALYSLNRQNASLENVKESLANVVNMFVKSKVALEGVEDFDAKAEDEPKAKELLLDDAVDTAVDADTESDTAAEIEIREEPVPQDVNLEASLSDVIRFRDDLVNLADRSTKLLTKFAKDDSENRLVALGLISGLYSVSEDVYDFIENISEEIEDSADKKDSAKTENLSVPAKVDYMKVARGSISQACSALKKTGECKDLLDVLKDIKSEVILRQK